MNDWPDGSKERALNGKSAIQAMRDAMNKSEKSPELPKPPPGHTKAIEQLSNDDLALALGGRIIKEMHRLGVKQYSARKGSRESNP